MSTVSLGGTPIEVAGNFPQTGETVPPFTLTGTDLKDVDLASFGGKRKVLNIVPSLDTATCAASTRRFNAEAGKLDDAVVLVISSDLPFAAKRFCDIEGLSNVTHLSTFRSHGFARDYGVDITTGPLAGLTARAVVVLDGDNKVIHAQLVDEIKNEPDYSAALSALG